MNKIILIGNLTRDPETGTTASGISYCRFGMAVNRRFSKEQNEVDYFNIVTWRGLADTCGRLLTKGKKVAVVGSIQMRSYQGNDGTQKTSVEVTADEVEFLSPRDQSAQDGGYYNAPANAAPKQKKDDISQLTPVEDDELPF